jgi:hypothetical protein
MELILALLYFRKASSGRSPYWTWHPERFCKAYREMDVHSSVCIMESATYESKALSHCSTLHSNHKKGGTLRI